MNKWIAEFDLEDGDTMPEHMDLEYKGAKLDFHCRPMWIPVSEKPPKGRYLCTYEHCDGKCIDFGSFDGEAWYIKPIAYMPLPEPYRESEVKIKNDNKK